MSRVARGARALLGLLALALPGGVRAQSVADIVERMYESYERQAEGIDDYTLVQTVMGVETTSRFVKEMVDGRPIFKLRDSGMQGFSFSLGDQEAGAGDVYVFGPALVEHGRYAGREEIDGSTVHVLAIDDLSAVDIARPTTPGNMQFEPKSARIYVDDEMLVPRRMELTGDAVTDQGPREVSVQIDMQNFLSVEGLWIPYRTVVRIEGIGAAIDPETRAQLEAMQRQLEEMPPDQRQMMEQMMGPQMEQIRQMLGGGDGAMTMEITVVDVGINTGGA